MNTAKAGFFVGGLRFVLLSVFFLLSREETGFSASLPKIEEGMASLQRKLTGNQGWSLKYRHWRWDEDGPRAKERRLQYESHEKRQGDSITIHRQIPDDGKQLYQGLSWHKGVGIQTDRALIVATPSYNPAFTQITNYTNFLFIDVTPRNAVWADAVKDVFQSKGPSDHFVVALPRSIAEHRAEWSLEATNDPSIVRLLRPNRDELLIDTAHGHICVYRKYCFRPGAPLFEVRNEDLDEVSPGLWLPRTQEIAKYYAPGDNESDFGKIKAREQNKLIEFEFQDLSEADLHLPLPERGHIYDQLNGVSYRRYPASFSAKEAVDAAIADAKAAGASIRGTGNSRFWFVTANVVLFVVLAVLMRKKSLEVRRHHRKEG